MHTAEILATTAISTVTLSVKYVFNSVCFISALAFMAGNSTGNMLVSTELSSGRALEDIEAALGSTAIASMLDSV